MPGFDDLTLATTTHNNAEMCDAMLASFKANIGIPAEIVIVDDQSDPTFAPSPMAAPVRVIRTELPVGFCKASDLALREVRTPYALLVDADVLFEPGDFAGGFREFKEFHWAWVNFRQSDFRGGPQSSFEHPLMPPWAFAAGNQIFALWRKSHREPNAFSGQRVASVDVAYSSCTLVDMKAFRAIGGFDPWYWQCQSDVDLSLRLRAKGYRVGVDLGYSVKHEGAGGKTGGTPRVLDLYRARLHLYETAYPSSRLYLRPVLFLRHLLELLWFAAAAPFRKDPRLGLRAEMLKRVLQGYK